VANNRNTEPSSNAITKARNITARDSAKFIWYAIADG